MGEQNEEGARHLMEDNLKLIFSFFTAAGGVSEELQGSGDSCVRPHCARYKQRTLGEGKKKARKDREGSGNMS